MRALIWCQSRFRGNELWTDKRMYMKAEGPSSEERKKFRDLLQFEDVYVPYHEFDHPTLGPILIGGTKKYSSWVTPPWMLEEGSHRNFAFTMFHADQVPQASWGVVEVKSLAEGLVARRCSSLARLPLLV